MTFDITDAPVRIKLLPRDDRGYPVPWFVATIDGTPDFSVMDGRRIVEAVKRQRCWVCGGPLLDSRVAFTIGPMCAVNRNTAEPPEHLDCAIYSATHCPFLTNPDQRRLIDVAKIAAAHAAAGVTAPAGEMIRRNPGVTLVWITRRRREPGGWEVKRDPAGGILFDVGDPVDVRWFTERRQATRDEVLASIDSGLPILRELAEQDGPGALEALERQHANALALVPA
jgi:hypothetical protein